MSEIKYLGGRGRSIGRNKREYGFIEKWFSDKSKTEYLNTGDGRSLFSAVVETDKTVSLTIGLGVRDYRPDGLMIGGKFGEDLPRPKWAINFESEESIDAFMHTLIDVKKYLMECKGKK